MDNMFFFYIIPTKYIFSLILRKYFNKHMCIVVKKKKSAYVFVS